MLHQNGPSNCAKVGLGSVVATPKAMMNGTQPYNSTVLPVSTTAAEISSKSHLVFFLGAMVELMVREKYM